jgi:hypothetical protein
MSYASITTCTRDTELQDRVMAAACKEAWAGGPEFSESRWRRLRTYHRRRLAFMWAIAIDNGPTTSATPPRVVPPCSADVTTTPSSRRGSRLTGLSPPRCRCGDMTGPTPGTLK